MKKRNKKEVGKKEKLINVPNFFTTLRVIITFIIVYMVFANFEIYLIAVLFVIGMITDAIDGNAARILKQKTEFGRKYDMIADRFLFAGTILSVLIHFSQTGFLGMTEILQILCIMTREIVALPSAIWAFFSGNITPRAHFTGKATTVLQAIAFPVVLLKLSFAWPAVIITGVAGLISGLKYNYDARTQIRGK